MVTGKSFQIIPKTPQQPQPLTPVPLRLVCGARPEEHPGVDEGYHFRGAEGVAVERDGKDVSRACWPQAPGGQGQKRASKRRPHSPTEFVRVLVVVSVKVNQEEAELPLGVVKCLWDTGDHWL